MIFDFRKQVLLDPANLLDNLADLTSSFRFLGIVVCMSDVIAQLTDVFEIASQLCPTARDQPLLAYDRGLVRELSEHDLADKLVFLLGRSDLVRDFLPPLVA